ncbi:MAG TPA: DUF3526 domain-containing protein [Chitinophagaceae bacterium]|jgi:ABC-2 type transport system permease protein|nr:DUF3526 domain-containing protein [Chitinophagaceae bacterium]
MRISIVRLLAAQTIQAAFRSPAVRVLLGILVLLLLFAAYQGIHIYREQTATRLHYQKEVRAHWEEMPDKHPHRMAHYGYIVFRPKHPLSVMDYGMESYTGNAVFLEAHRQNTVNFSEAGFSTGMLRFGEISTALVLQAFLPLVLFFVGFGAIAADREAGTLKILLSQGASWKELIYGKALGLWILALAVSGPFLLLMTLAAVFLDPAAAGDTAARGLGMLVSYALYYAVISLFTLIVSAVCSRAKGALVSLIGCWLVAFILIPRTAQALGTYFYPSPSRIAFEAAVEKELIRKGDSHNPDDPYYRSLKDSVLRAYGVDSVQQLPFNYSGFQMKEGERVSSETYNRHLQALLRTFERQNRITRLTSWINPYGALRQVSMAVSGTDFPHHLQFQQQAEAFRYRLAQHMNELQIRLISNRKPGASEKPHALSRTYWKAFPDFCYRQPPLAAVMKSGSGSFAALLCWLAALIVLTGTLTKKLKAF